MSNKENGTFCAWPPQSRQHNQPNWQTNKGIVGRHNYLPYLPGCDVLFCTCFQRRDWIAQQFCRQRGWSELNRCVESKKCNMSPAAILWPRLKTVYTTNRARSTFYHQAKHVCVCLNASILEVENYNVRQGGRVSNLFQRVKHPGIKMGQKQSHPERSQSTIT